MKLLTLVVSISRMKGTPLGVILMISEDTVDLVYNW
jgi:hypothetical protein